jgi:hypothetical protein
MLATLFLSTVYRPKVQLVSVVKFYELYYILQINKIQIGMSNSFFIVQSFSFTRSLAHGGLADNQQGTFVAHSNSINTLYHSFFKSRINREWVQGRETQHSYNSGKGALHLTLLFIGSFDCVSVTSWAAQPIRTGSVGVQATVNPGRMEDNIPCSSFVLGSVSKLANAVQNHIDRRGRNWTQHSII